MKSVGKINIATEKIIRIRVNVKKMVPQMNFKMIQFKSDSKPHVDRKYETASFYAVYTRTQKETKIHKQFSIFTI